MDAVVAKAILTMKKLVELLVSGHYQELERLSGGVRLTCADIDQAICDYDGVLMTPPDSDLDNIDMIEITDSNPRTWSVRYDLWTEEKGKSDLSLEVTLIDNDKEIMGVELDNIHVL